DLGARRDGRVGPGARALVDLAQAVALVVGVGRDLAVGVDRDRAVADRVVPALGDERRAAGRRRGGLGEAEAVLLVVLVGPGVVGLDGARDVAVRVDRR